MNRDRYGKENQQVLMTNCLLGERVEVGDGIGKREINLILIFRVWVTGGNHYRNREIEMKS